MKAPALAHHRHFISTPRIPITNLGRRAAAPKFTVRMSLQENAPSLAVVGITGAVGQEFLSIFSDRNFLYQSIKMLASKCSAEKDEDLINTIFLWDFENQPIDSIYISQFTEKLRQNAEGMDASRVFTLVVVVPLNVTLAVLQELQESGWQISINTIGWSKAIFGILIANMKRWMIEPFNDKGHIHLVCDKRVYAPHLGEACNRGHIISATTQLAPGSIIDN